MRGSILTAIWRVGEVGVASVGVNRNVVDEDAGHGCKAAQLRDGKSLIRVGPSLQGWNG